MLTNVKKGDRVVLVNGKKATVTGIDTCSATVSIKADLGLFETRLYSYDGTTGTTGFDVASVVTVGYPAKITTIKERLNTLQQIVEDAFIAILDEVEATQLVTKAPVAEKLTSYDFKDGKGSVPAHRHMNPIVHLANGTTEGGDEGGIVANSAFVDSSSRIGRGSVVTGTAQVINGAKVINNSTISSGVINGFTVDRNMLRAA